MTEPSAEIADFLLRPVTDERALEFGARASLHELLMLAMSKARETGHGLRLKVTMPKERVSIVASHSVMVPCRMERELDGLRIVAQRWRDRLTATPKMGTVQRLTLQACVEQLEAALEKVEEGEVAPDAPAAPEVDDECPF